MQLTLYESASSIQYMTHLLLKQKTRQWKKIIYEVVKMTDTEHNVTLMWQKTHNTQRVRSPAK